MSKEKKNRRDEHMTPAEAAEEALKEALEAETEQPAEPEEAPEAEAAEENPLAKQLEEWPSGCRPTLKTTASGTKASAPTRTPRAARMWRR